MVEEASGERRKVRWLARVNQDLSFYILLGGVFAAA
jgi:hypothetical protein